MESQSAVPCGCDEGANHVCEWHRVKHAPVAAGYPELIRRFDTGATRDTDHNKYEYSGFNSPAVEQRFAAYMHEHRKQSNGELRSSSNWKKGIPLDVYQQSLHRHFLDLWLIQDGWLELATEPDIEKVLCALRFNVNGMLLEVLKARKEQPGQCATAAVR